MNPLIALEPLGQAVYDILVREADAHDDESNRMQFDVFWRRRERSSEYRFIGSLGFGGKLWVDRTDRWRVNCYREDETDARLDTIARTNEALSELRLTVENLEVPGSANSQPRP